MTIPSLSSQEIVALNREYTFFSWSVQNTTNPIPMVKAEGIYFWDADGKLYIDFSSQLMNMNIGHQHQKVIKAIQDQAATLAFAHPGVATLPRGLLGKKLAEVTPGNLKKTFFALGGAEANENAVKIARFYTGRHKIMARYRSYHGATHGAIALTGDYRRLPVEPAMPGAYFANARPIIIRRNEESIRARNAFHNDSSYFISAFITQYLFHVLDALSVAGILRPAKRATVTIRVEEVHHARHGRFHG